MSFSSRQVSNKSVTRIQGKCIGNVAQHAV